MALVVNDRVRETSTTTGTGTLTLAGAITGFETFSTAIGNTNTTYYSIVNENGEFEVGLGTVGAGTLSRDTIISSSNSDAAVNFSAGTKDVFCTLPASKAVILDSSGNIVANNGSNLTNLNATNIASGTLSSDRLPTVPTTKGGTGLTAIGTANQVLAVNGAGTALEYQTPTTGDITGVTAGDGLTGGGTSGDVTLNVGAGTGIDVAADAISVDVSDFMTNGSNNRIVTATGTDGQNAEANLTFDGSTLDVTGTLLTDKGYIAETTLTDGATINWDMSDESVAKVTLGGNRTIAAPTNGSTGQFASLLVIQDGTGSRTLTWNAVYEFASDTAPTLSTDGGKADLFVFRYNGTKWLEVGRNLLLTVS